MLSDKAYRLDIVSQIKDPSVKAFWTKEFANYTERQAAKQYPLSRTKSAIHRQSAHSQYDRPAGFIIDFRKAMDERKIIIINLSRER